MIYLPKRAAFIHIPRTAGNSITNAIAKTCAGRGVDVIIGTAQVKGFGRSGLHIRAVNLKKSIEEWDDIYKFAIHRPLEERIESTLRLINRDKKNKVYLDPTCRDSWKKLISGDEDLLESTLDRLRKHTTEWFTLGDNGEDLGVEVYNYYELPEKWHEICDKCQIPRCELPHLNKA